MYKLVVITDSHTADGFRLAGVEVRVTDSYDEASSIIVDLMQDEETGIIALDERLSQAVDERIDRKLEKLYRPLLIMLPLGESVDSEMLAKKRLNMLIKKAIGFDVTVKRGQ